MRLAAVYLVVVVVMLGAVTLAGTHPGNNAPTHAVMNPVSHADYELRRSMGLTP